MAVWLRCLGAMLIRRVLYTKRTDTRYTESVITTSSIDCFQSFTRYQKRRRATPWESDISGYEVWGLTSFPPPSHIKIKLCVRLSALRWFYVGHVYKIGEVSFHLIGRNGFHVRGKNCPQAACRTSSTILFPHSTNQIIDLWRCRRCCRRRFVQNSLIGSAAHASSENAHGSPSDIPWLSQLFCACANFLARLQGSGWRRATRRTGLSFIPSLHQKSIKK